MVERDSDGLQPCRRSSWCTSSEIVFDTEDGKGRRVPSYGPRPFCDRCTPLVGHALEELPAQYAHLSCELGNPATRTRSVRVPFGPRVPLRVDVDALMALMVVTLAAWHERVAVVDRLSFPEGRLGRSRKDALALLRVGDLARARRPGRAVQRAVDVMAERVSILLALPPEPMVRVLDLRDLGDWLRPEGQKPSWVSAMPDDTPGVVHSGFAEINLDLDGGDAGMEILDLRYLCRAVLAQTKPQPELLEGVPCRADGCGRRTLVRAEPPSDPADRGSYSECGSCGDRMAEAEYREWTALCAAYERHRVRVPAVLENLPGAA